MENQKRIKIKNEFWFEHQNKIYKASSERKIRSMVKDMSLKYALIHREIGYWTIENKMHQSVWYFPRY